MRSVTFSRHAVWVAAALCLAILIAIVGVLVPVSTKAQPWGVRIESVQWLETKYEGYDSFYGTTIVAYETGSTAKLLATVFNNTDDEIIVDYARIQFGWSSTPGDATTKPATVAKRSYTIVIWEVPVPDNSVASNLIIHTWAVTVRYHVGDSPTSTDLKTGGSNFVVYSKDQVACRDSIDKWNANNDAYTLWGYKAQRMMTEALYLYNKAKVQYASGEFSSAKDNYASAVIKQEEAIKSDAAAALTGESAQTLAGTGGTKGTGFLIAGIGVLLAGIGVLIGALLWATRKKSPV